MALSFVVLVVATAELLLAQTQHAFDIDQALLPPGVTCQNAREAEIASGSDGTYDGPYDPARVAQVFKRKYHGDEASVIYMCQGGSGPVAHRVIRMQFETNEAASAAYERHRAILSAQLGAPCWDPQNLGPEQLLLMGDADSSELGLLEHRIEWNARPGVYLAVMLVEPGRGRREWVVTITSGELASTSRSSSRGLPDRLYDKSSCEKGTAESSSGNAPDRAR